MSAHSPVEIRLKDLTALKQRADSFLLPIDNKKALVGSGSSYSPFKSRGLDFQEVRVYQPGDDIRQIDWHVTAKYGKPFTKLYTEEKERTIFFVVDLRSSMRFATQGDFKSVVVARLATFMAFVAEHQQDKIGYLLLTDSGLVSSGPAAIGMQAQFLSSLVAPPTHVIGESNFTIVAETLAQLLPVGSFVFVFSDFYDWEKKHTALFAPLMTKNTLLLIPVFDRLEMSLPNDTLAFSDGKEVFVLSEQDKKARDQFAQNWQNQQQNLQKAATKYEWGVLPIITSSDYVTQFIHFCLGESQNAT